MSEKNFTIKTEQTIEFSSDGEIISSIKDNDALYLSLTEESLTTTITEEAEPPPQQCDPLSLPKTEHICCPVCDFYSSEDDMKEHIIFYHTKTPPYVCHECRIICKSRRTLANHLLLHVEGKPYKCSQCPFTCTVKSYLRSHVKFKHSGYRPYCCTLCSFKCCTKVQLTKHKISHMTEKPFKCNLCTYKCKTRGYLKNHMRIHTGEYKFQCSECSYQCMKSNSLRDHHIVHHSDEKPFKCWVCGSCFKLTITLNRHLMIHAEKKPFECHLCNFKCIRKGYLRNHLEVVHSPNKPYGCEECNYRYDSQKSLKRHVSAVHSVKPLSCSLCTFVCCKKVSLVNHAFKKHQMMLDMSRSVENNTYRCKYCDIEFHQKTQYKEHIRCHKSDVVFGCAFCPFTAKTRKTYNKHIESHLMHGKTFPEVTEETAFRPRQVTIHIDSEDFTGSHPTIKVEAESEPQTMRSDYGQMQILQISPSNKKVALVEIDSCSDSLVRNRFTSVLSDGPRVRVTPRTKTVTYQCDHCPFRCFKKREYKQHYKSHVVSRIHNCPACEEYFGTKNELKNHLALMHVDLRPYQCEHCGREFKLRETLRRHYVIHSDEKPYQCTMCSYSCKLKDKLKRHTLVHSDERPFQCSDCDYSCKTKELLKKHCTIHSRERESSVRK